MSRLPTVSDLEAQFPGRNVGVLQTGRPGVGLAGVENDPPNAEPYWLDYAVQDPRPLDEQAAMSFFLLAGRTLYKRFGPQPALATISRIVGESPSNFSEAMAGKRGGSLDRVARWIARWNAAGHPPFFLVVGEDFAEVVEARWMWMRPERDSDHVAGVGRTLEDAAQNAGADPSSPGELRYAVPGTGYGVPVAVVASESRWDAAWAAATGRRP